MKEEWKDIADYEGFYQISNLGRVKSFPRKFTTKKPRILKGKPTPKGYLQVSLSTNNKVFPKYIHRLVADAFVFNAFDKLEVNHKDGDKKNNKANNLEWVTHAENQRHAGKNGLMASGERSARLKLKDYEIEQIRYMRSTGYKLKYIAYIYGVTFQHISSICLFKERSSKHD